MKTIVIYNRHQRDTDFAYLKTPRRKRSEYRSRCLPIFLGFIRGGCLISLHHSLFSASPGCSGAARSGTAGDSRRQYSFCPCVFRDYVLFAGDCSRLYAPQRSQCLVCYEHRVEYGSVCYFHSRTRSWRILGSSTDNNRQSACCWCSSAKSQVARLFQLLMCFVLKPYLPVAPRQ